MNMIEVCFIINKKLSEMDLKDIKKDLKLIPSVLHVQIDPISRQMRITYEGEIGTLDEIKMAMSPEVFQI